MSAFEHVVRACDGGTLVVIDMKRCNPASRAWWDWGRGGGARGREGGREGTRGEEISEQGLGEGGKGMVGWGQEEGARGEGISKQGMVGLG